MKNKEQNEEQNKQDRSFIRGPCNIIGIVLCVLLIPILITNCLLIIKGMTNSDEVPSIGKYSPLIVLTESMEPEIKPGDLIICKKISSSSELKEGVIISFFDPTGKGTSVVTHKIVGIETDEETGKIYYRTKGVNNNIEDRSPVPYENVIGIYTGVRLAFVGRIVLFAQTPVGMITCIAVPIALFLAFLYFEKRRDDRKKQCELEKLKEYADKETTAQSRVDELEAELAALRASVKQETEHSETDEPNINQPKNNME